MTSDGAQRHCGGFPTPAANTSSPAADPLQGPLLDPLLEAPRAQQEPAQISRQVVKRRVWGLFTLETRATETRTSRQRADARHSLERVHERVHRHSTAWDGRVLEDEVRETTVLEDHLGRVHSAQRATHRDGKLVSEAAALYMPAGQAASGKAADGGLASGVRMELLSALGGMGSSARRPAAGNANVSNGYAAGNNGTAAAAAARAGPSVAVGYVYENGSTVWGIISDPQALGLPSQRTACTQHSPWPPPWQQLPVPGTQQRKQRQQEPHVPQTPQPQHQKQQQQQQEQQSAS